MAEPGALRDTLEIARALDSARDYPALHARLSALTETDLHSEPELAFLLADVSRRVGDRDRAAAILDRLHDEIRRRGNDRLFRNCLNLGGIIRFDRAQFQEAEHFWRHLLDAASEAGDEEFIARANNNLGILCTLDGRREEALACYARAVGAYQRLGYLRGLAQAHQNLAIAFREMGFFREADSHFQDAFAFARDDGSQDEMGRVEQERALLLLLEGDVRLARATARRALERYQKLGDPSGIAEVERVLGLVALKQREFGPADAHLNRALAGARSAHAALLEAEILEALAALNELRNLPAAARELRAQAERGFAGIRAAKWGQMARQRVLQIANLTPRENDHL